jgi:hypothetical protein
MEWASVHKGALTDLGKVSHEGAQAAGTEPLEPSNPLHRKRSQQARCQHPVLPAHW